MPLVFVSLWEWYFFSEGDDIYAKMRYFMNTAGATTMLAGSWAKLPAVRSQFGGPAFGNLAVAYGASTVSVSKFWSAFVTEDGNGPHRSTAVYVLVGFGMSQLALQGVLVSVLETFTEDVYDVISVFACFSFVLAAVMGLVPWIGRALST